MRSSALFPLLLVVLFTGNSMQAQDPLHFRAGISLGAVATDIPGMDNRDPDSDFKKLGFSFGGLISAQFNKNTLQLEINFTQKGSQQDPDSLNEGYFKLALNYIDVPLIFRHKLHMNIRKKPNDKLEIEGGIAYERLVSYSYIDGSNYPITVNKNSLNFSTASLLAGLDFNLTPNILLCLRYSNSFIPALKRNNIPTQFLRYAYNSGNNQVVLFAVKYVFGSADATVSKSRGINPGPAATPN